MKTKFYCPLTIRLYEWNEYGDIDDTLMSELDGRFAEQYSDEIHNAIKKYTSLDDEDMAEYFDGSSGAKSKLKSMQWGVESIGGELYGVITADITEPLTDNEKSEVSEFIISQNADGWGEGFEQCEIKVDDGLMYVSFWNSGDDYYIKDQDEFNEYLSHRKDIRFGGMSL